MSVTPFKVGDRVFAVHHGDLPGTIKRVSANASWDFVYEVQWDHLLLGTLLSSRHARLQPAGERAIVLIGWDAHSQPIRRYRDEMHMHDSIRSIVGPS